MLYLVGGIIENSILFYRKRKHSIKAGVSE
jgi:hypothetical protein